MGSDFSPGQSWYGSKDDEAFETAAMEAIERENSPSCVPKKLFLLVQALSPRLFRMQYFLPSEHPFRAASPSPFLSRVWWRRPRECLSASETTSKEDNNVPSHHQTEAFDVLQIQRPSILLLPSPIRGLQIVPFDEDFSLSIIPF